MSLILQLQDLGVDLSADAAGDDVSHFLEVLQKLLDAVVGVLLADEHGVVGDGVVDGDARVLNGQIGTSDLSMQLYIIKFELIEHRRSQYYGLYLYKSMAGGERRFINSGWLGDRDGMRQG
jgi:hypothetical protein